MPLANDISRLPVHQSSVISASGQVVASGGFLWGVLLNGGSAASTLIVYDNTSGSGTQLFSAVAPIGTSIFCDLTNLGPQKAFIGLYATLSGAGATAQIWFDA